MSKQRELNQYLFKRIKEALHAYSLENGEISYAEAMEALQYAMMEKLYGMPLKF